MPGKMKRNSRTTSIKRTANTHDHLASLLLAPPRVVGILGVTIWRCGRMAAGKEVDSPTTMQDQVGFLSLGGSDPPFQLLTEY